MTNINYFLSVPLYNEMLAIDNKKELRKCSLYFMVGITVGVGPVPASSCLHKLVMVFT